VHILDNAAYNSLIGHHSHLAESFGEALRYRPDVSLFHALPDNPSPQAWRDLAELAQGEVILMRDQVHAGESWREVGGGDGRQYLASEGCAQFSAKATVLGDEDVPAMLDLVARTQPGPFSPRTIELGHYTGIWCDGVLAAMAGCRFHVSGYREISAVCTDPAFRGQGLAGELVRHVTALINQAGDEAFLHVNALNTSAISLYEGMGFRLRRTVHFGLFQPDVSA
jgi:ribosomal protein S18 acetylase RimI-like enzyme